METLNKKDIISQVASKTGQSKKDTEETLDALIDVITDNIRNDKKVNFAGFGSFQVSERKGRTGVNPQTGEKIQIPATKVPKFKSGAHLKQAVK